MAHRPVGVNSSFTFTAGAATTSSAFSVQSSVLRVVAVGGSAHVAIGVTPAATTADYYVPAGDTVTLGLTKASNRVVGITTGTTTIVIVPEGTQVPFAVGDYVTLTATGQSYYDFHPSPSLLQKGQHVYHQIDSVFYLLQFLALAQVYYLHPLSCYRCCPPSHYSAVRTPHRLQHLLLFHPHCL